MPAFSVPVQSIASGGQELAESDTTQALSLGQTRPDAARYAWLKTALGIESAATALDTLQRPVPGIVAIQKCCLAWDKVRKALQQQLNTLEKSIVQAVEAHNADPDSEDKFDVPHVTAATRKLHDIMLGFDDGLLDKLDAVLNAAPEKRAVLLTQARKTIEEYKAFLANDPMLQFVDQSGFATTAIRPTAEKALAILSQTI